MFLFIILCKVSGLTFESVDEILKYDHSNEIEVLQLSSTFLWSICFAVSHNMMIFWSY